MMNILKVAVCVTVFLSVFLNAAFAQVVDGQPVNAVTTNAAFWKRNVNDTGFGIYTVNNSTPSSGTSVTNIQAEMNSCSSFTGKAVNAVFNALPTWINNDVGLSTDTLKDRSDYLTAKFNASAGHKHTGASGDAPQLTDTGIASAAAISRSKLATGSPNFVVVNDGSGFMSQAAFLAITQGGTNASTASAGFDNLAPTTTKGDLIIRSSTTNSRFPVCSNGDAIRANSAQTLGWECYTPSSSAGTVTSVALASPPEFTVSGSPVTTSGTLTLTKANESANFVWAGPTSGGAAQPTFRALVAADIPSTSGSDHDLFVLNGGVTFVDDFDGVRRSEGSKTINKIVLCMFNSGSSGTTTVTLDYGAALGSTTTISLTATGGTACSSTTPAISLVANDLLNANVTAVADGAPADLSIRVTY